VVVIIWTAGLYWCPLVPTVVGKTDSGEAEFPTVAFCARLFYSAVRRAGGLAPRVGELS